VAYKKGETYIQYREKYNYAKITNVFIFLTWQFVHCKICQHISETIHKRFQAVRYFKVKISTRSNRAKIGICFGVKFLIFLVPQRRNITTLPSRHRLAPAELLFSRTHLQLQRFTVCVLTSYIHALSAYFFNIFYKAPFTKPLIIYSPILWSLVLRHLIFW
jgi:hypothetical protein